MTQQTGGLREAIGRAVDFVRGGPNVKQQQFIRTPAPSAEWMTLKLAATWLSGKIPQGTIVDGKDGRLEQAAALLFECAKVGKIEMLSLDDDRTHYVRKAAMEKIMLAGAVTISLSTDPSGGFINRGADGEYPKAKDPIVVERGKQQRTEIASEPLSMPSPFGPRSGKIPEASSGPFDPGWQNE
jgi:hypothetical protein